jgi:hypothetical protein
MYIAFPFCLICAHLAIPIFHPSISYSHACLEETVAVGSLPIHLVLVSSFDNVC